MRQKLFLSMLIVLVILSGCSKYGYVRLNYPQPPQAFLPEEIHNIAIINRSLTPEENKKSKTLEVITTGEVAGSDRIASDESLKGIIDAGKALQDITFVVPNPSRYQGTGTRETPDILDWQTVGDICQQNKADLLLVLETFDSNSDLLATTAMKNVGSILSGEAPKSPVLPNRIRMNVQSYWRLYDPAKQQVVDHFQHNSFMTFDPVDGLLPMAALPETAYLAGKEYVFRFLPSYYTVKRELYKKAKGSAKREFEAGFRRTEMANWQEAISIWENLVASGNRKTAGRACLNIAVAHEVLGETVLALQWAKRSYQDFDDKLGRDYAKILIRRQQLER